MYRFLSAEGEPLRRYLYGVLASLVAVAVLVGVLTSEQGVAITAVIGAGLLVPAIELTRSKVTPVGSVATEPEDADPLGLAGDPIQP